MSLRRSKVARKTIVVCPRCGKTQSILVAGREFMVLCPRCGAGMRERLVRSRPESQLT